MVVILPGLMGGVVLLAAIHLWLWLGRRGDTLPLWVAAWCGTTLLYLAGHHIQLTAETPAGTLGGSRLTLLAALALIPVFICLSQILVGKAPAAGLVVPAVAVSAVLAVLAWTTGLLQSGEVYVRTDLLGVRYPAAMPGPLMSLLVPYIAIVFWYVWRANFRLRSSLPPGEWRLVRLGFMLYVACGINDAMHAARIIQSVRVFDFAFVGVAVGLTYLLTRRHNELHAHLE